MSSHGWQRRVRVAPHGVGNARQTAPGTAPAPPRSYRAATTSERPAPQECTATAARTAVSRTHSLAPATMAALLRRPRARTARIARYSRSMLRQSAAGALLDVVPAQCILIDLIPRSVTV